MNTPSKHKKIIKAWADGATVRCRSYSNRNGEWLVCGAAGEEGQPGWLDDFEYEVVPASTIVRFNVYANKDTGEIVLARASAIQKCDEKKLNVLEIEIDSETGQLIGFQNITP